jgi:hypothetical protein
VRASQADFDATRALVNERLLLSGFRVVEDGKVARVRAAVTLDEALLMIIRTSTPK